MSSVTTEISKIKNKETGVVLFLSLVFMVLIAMLGMFTVRSATSEIKIATNVQARASAFSDAELGIKSGEKVIANTLVGAPAFDWSTNVTDGFYYDGDVQNLRAIWNGNPGYETGDDASQFIVEYLGPFTTEGSSIAIGAGTLSNQRYVYRVTGRGQSARGGYRLSQSIYAVSE